LLLLVVALVSLFVSTARAGTISSTELIEKSKRFDGNTVSYQGEVVGDVMKRGDYAWINVNDGVNAMGIWLPAEKTKIIEFRGDYKNRGDTVEVRGIFNRACAQHGGDMDIHANDIRLVKRGHPLDNPVSGLKIVIAGALSIMSGLLFLAGRRRSRKRI
jgi:hypothetical protein